MTIISSGWQQLAFIMPSIRAEAILPNPRNPKVKCEREVIMLLSECKCDEWGNGRMGERADGRVGEWANGRMGEWANGRMGEWACGRARGGETLVSRSPALWRGAALQVGRSVGSQPPKGFRGDRRLPRTS